MTQQEILKLQKQIKEEHRQALINVWCSVHGFDPSTVIYKDGMLCIPFEI